MNDYAFDASGNTTKDANGRTFVYDAENKQIEVKNASNETIGQYWFDGDGRRVKKRGWINGQWETTVFVYDASSLLVAEYSTILNETPQVAYLTNDHLGSPRINTNENGAVVSRHDYRPYGEEITERRHSQYAADTVRKQFTSYERDGETGLDFAQARYFASGHGRFSSADSPFADQSVSDPQSWNLFVYVRNNPLNFTDPSGLFRWSNALGGTSTDKELADELNQLETEQFKNPKIDNSERITQLQGILGSRSRIVSAMNEALSSADSAFLSPQEQQALRDSIAAYGTPGVDNGVTVGMSLDTTTGGSTHTEGRQIIVALNLGDINAINLAHEGSHVVEASVYLANGTNPSLLRLRHVRTRRRHLPHWACRVCGRTGPFAELHGSKWCVN
ncbi:MAG: hypothetical protein IPJ30_19155 [Acidobacteria bacterium]|nr:hypothetical protein [Acidobacteriota bacterium]